MKSGLYDFGGQNFWRGAGCALYVTCLRGRPQGDSAPGSPGLQVKVTELPQVPAQRLKRLGVKKHDEKTAPTTVVETEVPPVAANRPVGRSAVPLDAPLGSKLDAVADPGLRAQLAARLRLIEANLLGRLDAASDEEASDAPEVDVAKSQAIAAQLKKKPQA